jgi:hypothetical protein
VRAETRAHVFIEKESKLANRFSKFFPWLVVAGIFIGMVNLYPPGASRAFTWARWLAEDTPLLLKLAFLLKTYARPAALSFIWIVGFQLQARLSTQGAPIAWVMCILYLSVSCMIMAWRSLAGGLGMLPGYALGIAAAQAMATRVAAVTRPEWELLGWKIRGYRIIWRGDEKRVAEVRARHRAEYEARTANEVRARQQSECEAGASIAGRMTNQAETV